MDIKEITGYVDPKTVPKRVLYTGCEIPALGIGTFGSDKYGAQEISEAVYGAVCGGYRLIDCASVYQNEKEIGAALKKLFDDKVVTREELFITGKVWNDMHGDGEVIQSCDQSLKDLGLDYFDLYLVHWPFPNYHAPGCDGDSRNPDSRPFFADEFMAVWRQCEQLVEDGKVKHIGMSNMTIKKLEQVLPVMAMEVRGRFFTLIARGGMDEIEQKLAPFKPLALEAMPLTLEEVFMYEMEVMGYDANVIFKD